MKKDRLFFFLLISVWFAVLAAGNFSVPTRHGFAYPGQTAGSCEVSVPAYPHTELDVQSVHAPAASRCVQSTDAAGMADATAFAGLQHAGLALWTDAARGHASHKTYLSFIYPSHNFW